jgi:TolB-like protein/tetratricopeptide (TPR) repeat protein/tRNA A-37 threonylcarbamoyl transferase component Bud32
VTDDLRDQLQTALGSAYAIERELGGGGMSRVFVAIEQAFGRHVVLKVLRPEVAEAVSVERFRRETQLAARLQHPHIVPLLGGGEAGGFLYYTMPLVEGESLRTRLEAERQLPAAEALRLARESAEALAYAHARGVVHRDIKPENILLSDGHALVTDFGIARALDTGDRSRLTTVGLVVGTPAYMSPEQASGETEIDGRSDIYSLGCVLYEMLVGEPPFTGPTVQAIIARRFTDRAPSLRDAQPTVEPEVDRITTTAMATLPADRFATATELARALDQAAVRAASGSHEARSPHAAAPGVTSRPPLNQRLRPNAKVLAAAGAVVAILGAVWGASRVRGARGTATPIAATASRPVSEPATSPSVAVLYLNNKSADTLDAYLADGLTEEITSRLGRLGRLRIKSRGAVARLRSGAVIDPSEAGRTLGVQYVVSGDVSRIGNRVRASVQLVRTADDSEVWSGTYETARDSLVAVRDSIVEEVALHASGGLSAGDRAALVHLPIMNAEAHDHYLRGNFQLAKRNPVSVASAIDEFETAHRIDPAMTNALARGGYAYAVFADWGWPHPRGLTHEQMIQRGLAAADSALRQDSTSAEAWMARAHLLFLRNPRTLDGVVPAFQRAVTLDSSNAEAQYQYGQALMASGNAARAIARYRRAVALEPDWASPLMSLGSLVARSGDFNEGLRWLDSAVAVDPSSSYSYAARSTTRSAAGRAADALRDAQSAVRVATGYRIPPYAAMATALALGGDTATARRWTDSAFRQLPDTNQLSPTDAFYVAAAFVRTGQPERGFQMLERANERNAWLWFYMTSPLFDGVRNNPRFVRVSDRAKPPGV